MGRTGEYWVDTELMICTCPDYKYRRRQRGQLCRHLRIYRPPPCYTADRQEAEHHDDVPTGSAQPSD